MCNRDISNELMNLTDSQIYRFLADVPTGDEAIDSYLNEVAEDLNDPQQDLINDIENNLI